MLRTAAHEAHHIAQPVRQSESQMRFVERLRLDNVRRIDHYVAKLSRYRLPLLEQSERALLHVRRHLDETAVQVEEPQTVPTSRSRQYGRVAIDLHPCPSQALSQEVDLTDRLRRESNQVETLQSVLSQPQDVVLWVSGGPEARHSRIAGHGHQPSHLVLELNSLLIVRNSKTNMPQIHDRTESRSHR